MSRLARSWTLLPPLAVAAPAAFFAHPAVFIALLLAVPLFLAAFAQLFGASDGPTWGQRLALGFLPALIWTLAHALLVAALLGWPALLLLRDGAPLSAVWLSAGVAALLWALTRFWPVFGLVWQRPPFAQAESGSPGSIARLSGAVRRALASTGGFAYAVQIGLPVAIMLAAQMVAAFGLSGLFGTLPYELHLVALLFWALLLSPMAALLVVWRSRLLEGVGSEAPRLELAADSVNAAPDERVLIADGGALDRAIDPYPPTDPAGLASSLLTAAAGGEVDRALDLLRQGADPAAMPALDARDQRSLAIIAATLRDLRLLREIIARGGDLNRAVGGLTPLLAATRDSVQGRADTVMTLLTNGADARIADAEGNTPLHHTARCTDPALTAMLLDAGADRDALNQEGHSALAIAAATHNDAVMGCLLDRGAVTEPARGLPALVAAMSGNEDRPDAIKPLLKRRARIDARDVLGRTALHAAALHGHAESVAALLASGADVDAHDRSGVTPLMEAARAGHDEVLRRLIRRKPAPNEVDAAGRTALVIGCQSRRATPATVALLLEAGCDPSLPTREGKRALDFAVNAGRWREVALLDPMYALPASVRDQSQSDEHDVLDADAKTSGPPDRAALLGQALLQRRFAIADELLALNPPLGAASLAEAFAHAAARIDRTGFSRLLRHGFDVAAYDREGRMLLHRLAAVRPLPVRALQLLSDGGASPAGGRALADLLEGAVSLDGSELGTALKLAQAWVGAGAEVSRASATGLQPLELAVRLGAAALVDPLLVRGADPRRIPANGRGLLHRLTRIEDGAAAVAIARSLIRTGADPRARDAQGQTPQGAALSRGRSDLARWLAWPLWQPPGRALRDADLPAAAAAGDRNAVQSLLELGLPLDARDAQGCTALIRAAGGGFGDIALLLLARGADADTRSVSGMTALGAALNAGRLSLVERLMEHGIAVDQRLIDEATPLMLAAALGRGDAVSRLLGFGADALARDAQGNTALHAAAQFAYTSAEPDQARLQIQQLLDAGAEIDARNASGQTPLLVLLGARNTPQSPPGTRVLPDLGGVLVHAGASLDVQDTRGVGVLHAAAMHGLLDTVRWLLRAGAEPRLRDTLGRTAHDVALVLGYVDVAAELRH